MKTKILSLAVMALIGTSTLFAQHQIKEHNGDKRKDKVKAMKIAYLTSELELTTEEAEKFWPVYNEYTAKKEDYYKTLKKSKKEHNNIDELSDSQLEEMYQAHFKLKKQLLELENTYHAKFKNVLPARKVYQLHHSEETFKRELLKKIKKGGDNPLNIPPPPPAPKK